MIASLAVPSATSSRELKVDRLVAERAHFNAALAPRKLSFTHFLAYAVAQAAAVHPALVAHYEEREGVPFKIEPASISLGLAVDVVRPDGSRLLLVPILRAAETLDFAAFAAGYDDLIARARGLRLAPDEMAGPDLTLTNPGSLGTYASVPRLMPGQGAIVATGALRKEPGGARIMVSSTYDHRIISGAQSALFLATLADFLDGADGFYEDAVASFGISPAVNHTPPPTILATAVQPARSITPSLDPDLTAAAVQISPATPATRSATRPAQGIAPDRRSIAAAAELLDAWRSFGHRAARLDPLGGPAPGDPALYPATYGLDQATLAAIDATAFGVGRPGESAANVLAQLEQVYGGTISYEFEHLGRHVERAWLRAAVERGTYARPLVPADQIALLDSLTKVEAFEQFLGRAYLGQTRFSLEGLDALIPALAELATLAAAADIGRIELGMAHRGRLNVLAHLVGVPYGDILADFVADRDEAALMSGQPSDVRYHRGALGTITTPFGPLPLELLPNPSHLEAIDPVLLGSVRARQTDRTVAPDGARDTKTALAVIIHGDASFAGQGVVAETFNIARLPGYTVGGAIHIITNNQIGFTTPPELGRSTDYASDLAKGFDVPIVHVNADDPEATLTAVRLAFAYRARFGADFVIDLVGYRRLGHNEADEPAYTQPAMYAAISTHMSVRAIYASFLERAGVIGPSFADERKAAALATLAAAADQRSQAPAPKPATLAGQSLASVAPPVSAARLAAYDAALHTLPPGFNLNKKLSVQLERRAAVLPAGAGIAWAHAEALALASLLTEGIPVRLSGQDTTRGTFSQRHLVLHDAISGDTHIPLSHLRARQAAFEVIDSPLSEYATMGFEYGYAVAAPDALVCWEAQYGDFENGAEIVVDQFLIAGRAKWGQESRLTLLLPHGYEGQGPEHSSARLERFLALGAEDNIRVAQPSTPAQYFHLLRDQAWRSDLRPLVILTPKSLLRNPAATSNLAELTGGSFAPVIDDDVADPASVRRLVLTSGKLYYELAAAKRPAEVALARIELLYPLPVVELTALLARYDTLNELVWAQEEPHNMGARKFIVPSFAALVGPGVIVSDVSRPDRASPAEGRLAGHAAEQARIVAEALG